MVKRIIIAQDYEGCYYIVAGGGVEAELEGKNKRAYEHPKNAAFKDRLLQTQQQ